MLKLVIPYVLVIMVKTMLSIDVGSGGMYYMNVIILFYVVFFAVTAITSNISRIIMLMALWNVVYAVGTQLCIGQITSANLFGWGSQSLGFTAGVLLCAYREQVSLFLRKRTIVIVPIMVLVSLISGMIYIRKRDINYISNEEFMMRIIISFCVICIIFSLSTHLVIGNRFCIFMGNKCMYVFLLHGVVIGMIDKMYHMADPGVYMLLVVSLTLVVSIIIEFMVENIKRFWGKFVIG